MKAILKGNDALAKLILEMKPNMDLQDIVSARGGEGAGGWRNGNTNTLKIFSRKLRNNWP